MSMELYDEDELQAAIKAGERRIALARQRKRRSARWRVGLFVLLVGAVPLLVLAGIASGQAPPAPLLKATWPRPKIEQIFASGQTLRFRSGQPFELAVTNSQAWDVTWVTGGIEHRGDTISWSPTDAARDVVAHCRPVASDWRGIFSFLWPSHQLTLHSVVAKRVDDYGATLQTPDDGAWVAPFIFASGHLAWDERALSRVVEITPPDELAGAALDENRSIPSKLAWRVVSDFEGYSEKPSRAGTFVARQSQNLEAEMPEFGARLVQNVPNASIKFIVRLDKTPAEGIIRLDFDGKRERKAWVRRMGEAAGAPFTGWEDGNIGGSIPLNIAPTIPR